jgi:hypothetical protein
MEEGLDAGESKGRGVPYNSSITCGTNSSQASGVNFGTDNPPPRTSLAATVTRFPVSPVTPKETDCAAEDGYIIVDSDGYYLIKPNYENISTSLVRYLGSNPNSLCLVHAIGNIEHIPVQGLRSTCNPSRWAYDDGVRKHSVPREYNIWCSMPMIDSTLGKSVDHVIPMDSVHFSHYGYNFSQCDGAGANLGGCCVNNDTAFFSRKELYVSIQGVDWVSYDTLTWDYPAYNGPAGARGIRKIWGFDKEISCGTIVLSGQPVQRFLDQVNYDRYCELTIHKLKLNDALSSVCDKYAHRMAQFKFVAHDDPGTGKSSTDRVNDEGIPFLRITETLASVTNLPAGTTEQGVIDALWNALKESKAHYDALTSVYFYQIGFGYAYQESNNTWYGCAIVLVQETDTTEKYQQSRILYTDPPVMRNPIYQQVLEVISSQSGLTAICTAPSVSNDLSGIVRSCFDCNFSLLGLEWRYKDKDYFSYDWHYNGDASEGIDTSNPHEYYPDILCMGGFIRPNNPYEYSKFWIQRDIRNEFLGDYRRDIRVELEGCNGDAVPPPSPNPGNRDYFRTTPTLLPEEVEPEMHGDTHGNCRLYIGNCQVDEARRYSQSAYLNPWQSLMVGSVFYTVSGYTAITYTMPKMLNTTLRKWDYSSNGKTIDVNELYWWLKIEYWAAIINPSGVMIARWKLQAAPPDFSSGDPTGYTPEDREYESNTTQEYTFQLQGMIQPISVVIEFRINTQKLILIDNGAGKFKEDHDQIHGYETVVADSHIDYYTGTIDITFGPAKPDKDTKINLFAMVKNQKFLVDIATYQEIVQYESDVEFYQPYQISFGGVHVLFPNLTVSEDGSVAVFSCRTCGIKFEANPRLGYGDVMKLTKLSKFSNDYGKGRLQVQLFDLTNMSGTTPKSLTYPLSLRETTGDVLLLN